jgi:hypothetical protein
MNYENLFNEKSFKLLGQLRGSYKLSKCVCDPIEYQHRQKLLLEAVTLAAIHLMEIIQEEDDDVED